VCHSVIYCHAIWGENLDGKLLLRILIKKYAITKVFEPIRAENTWRCSVHLCKYLCDITDSVVQIFQKEVGIYSGNRILHDIHKNSHCIHIQVAESRSHLLTQFMFRYILILFIEIWWNVVPLLIMVCDDSRLATKNMLHPIAFYCC
jgi:hypothetical protein